jgi:hypothetical protein
MHKGGFIMFGPIMQGVLNIKQLFHSKVNKIKSKKCLENWGMFLVLLELNLLMNGFYDCDYVVLKLKVQEIEF